MIKLDPQSRIPLYEQLEEQIIRLSLLGVLDEHEQLPSVRALARDVGVNPNTVAKAYQELERQASSTPSPAREVSFPRMCCLSNSRVRQPRGSVCCVG